MNGMNLPGLLRTTAILGVAGLAVASLSIAETGPTSSLAGTGFEPARNVQTPAVSDGAVGGPVALSADLTELDRCLLQGCLDEWVQNAIAQLGAGGAVDLVASSTSPNVVGSCHTIMHSLGEEASTTGDPATVMTQADGVCQFGFQHGVLIGVAGRSATDEEFATSAPTVCAAFGGDELSRTSCIHGIGHAAAVRAETDLVRAVGMCSPLNEDANHCVTGAVMEWSWTPFAADGVRGGDESVLGVCDTLREDYRPACYREIPPLWSVGGIPVSDQLDRCGALVGLESEMCATGVGFREGFSTRDTTAIIAACGSGPLSGVCLGGAAQTFYEAWYRTEPTLAVSLCPAVADEADRASCSAMLEETINAYAGLTSAA